MKMILKTKGITSCIEVESDDLDILEVWETLIRPLLLGAGYQEDSIKGLITEYEKSAA